MSCFPIQARGESAPTACLVVWSPDLGPLGASERTAVDRAVILASLMMSRAAAGDRSLEEAFQDVLTGLGNRRSFFQALNSRIEAADSPALLYIDIDGFKEINDRLGRLAGDSALRVIARRLSSVLRPTDDLARIGGDEFAILCAGDVNESQVIAIAARAGAEARGEHRDRARVPEPDNFGRTARKCRRGVVRGEGGRPGMLARRFGAH